MTLRPLSPLLAVLVLTACMSAEAQIKQEIAEANYCDTAADCEDAGGKCPFDCYIHVNKKEVEHIRTLVDGYELTCQYSCLALTGVDCIDHKCKALTNMMADPGVGQWDPAGNVGESCTTHEECVTPAEYLSRSSCPFTSMCIEGKCGVVCPMAVQPDSQAACKADADCKCDEFLAGSPGRCACIDAQCVKVIGE